MMSSRRFRNAVMVDQLCSYRVGICPKDEMEKDLNSSILMPMPGSTSQIDPFAPSPVQIDEEMDTLPLQFRCIFGPSDRKS